MNYGQTNHSRTGYEPAQYSHAGDLGWIGCTATFIGGLVSGAIMTFFCFAVCIWLFASALWVASIYVGPVIALLLWLAIVAILIPLWRRTGGSPAAMVFLGGLGAVPVTLGVIAGAVWLLYAMAT
ncbi:hypothetical protein [Nocardia crassostreae]|uniref:hypothetical protein n=1 Tax=Nocardia crassostreae TaxID=53428 RepID=UPI00082BC45A|nr:hypothetical protein [Nocardia crassostreae]